MHHPLQDCSQFTLNNLKLDVCDLNGGITIELKLPVIRGNSSALQSLLYGYTNRT